MLTVTDYNILKLFSDLAKRYDNTYLIYNGKISKINVKMTIVFDIIMSESILTTNMS